MEADGNLVLYNENKTKHYWNSGTYGFDHSSFSLQDDGSAVVRRSSGALLWTSNSHSTCKGTGISGKHNLMF